MGKTWTPENTGAEYTIASRDQNFNAWNYQYKDVSLQKNRYIRLKSLVVGYTLPKQLLSKIFIKNLRVYFSGQNLLTFDKLPKGIDPLVPNDSQGAIYPIAKSYTFGIDLSF